MSKASRRRRKNLKAQMRLKNKSESKCEVCDRPLAIDVKHLMDGVAGCIDQDCEYLGHSLPIKSTEKPKEVVKLLKKTKRSIEPTTNDEMQGIYGLHEYKRR